ncbi:MAG TPA: pilin [Spongiibacteraceae bacterium]|nr:pilin [Spongiibacteraceae bacterium]
MTSRRGFTLIEMLVVISIIAILAMVALPNTQDKIIRSQIAEALPLADIAKAPIAASWSVAHTFPVDNAAAGLPVADKIVNNFISAVTVENGAIHIVFGNRANVLLKDKILTLRPAVVDDAPVVPVTWICGSAPVPDKMAVKGSNKTNVPPNYLPLMCRG